MRYLHTLSLLVMLSFLLACGNARQDNRIFHDIPPDMAGVASIVEHVPASVSKGDRVAMLFVCGGRETTVIHDATVTEIPPHRADEVINASLLTSLDEGNGFTDALHSSGCTASGQYMTLKQLP